MVGVLSAIVFSMGIGVYLVFAHIFANDFVEDLEFLEATDEV